MIGFDKEFEQQCGEYLSYLYELGNRLYGDCAELDVLVQDTLTSLIVKMSKGERVEHPKGFLAAVLKNKYNGWLRDKYKKEIVEYNEDNMPDTLNTIEAKEMAEEQSEEYTSVRREIGRLIRIYREVAVRHYVHGQTVDQIAKELNISRGTVLSRLSSARNQIKEGLENMEKYSQISYEPKSVTIGIWGSEGLDEEPFTLVNSEIEANILILAYENPVSVRGIADTMGMPSAYLEPIIDKLVKGELMGRTTGGLVYTRCYLQRYEEAFGNIPEQEKLAEKYASQVWDIVWKHVKPLMERDAVNTMSDKQKATLILLAIQHLLAYTLYKCRPNVENELKEPPERPNGGKWLATGTIFENGQKRDSQYDASGPAHIVYSKEGNNQYDCQMFDYQSVFGDTHWEYRKFKYNCSLKNILRLYASFLPGNIKPESEMIYELMPEFERLNILKRDTEGKLMLNIPALPIDEAVKYWRPVMDEIMKELWELLSEDLKKLWVNTKNRVPKHVDEAAYFLHAGALSAYTTAQLLAIVEQKLIPYPVIVGKTPLILVIYGKKEEE